MNVVRQLPAIKRAINDNDVDAVHRLLAEEPYLVIARCQGWTPLQDAAFQARTQIVKVMLAEGSGITPVDIAHALHHAVQLKRSKTLRLLLESGANVNGRTRRGRTALFSAATAGWGPEDSVKVLLQYGAEKWSDSP